MTARTKTIPVETMLKRGLMYEHIIHGLDKLELDSANYAAVKLMLRETTFRPSKGVRQMGAFRLWRNRQTKEICRSEITISRLLLTKVEYKAQLFDTILHEVAHLVTYVVHGLLNHGREWKRVAQALGANPDAICRDEAYNGDMRERMKVVARCGKCGKEWMGLRVWSKRKGANLRRGGLSHGEGCHGTLVEVRS